MIREHNPRAVIITTPWNEIRGTDILEAMEGSKDLKDELLKEIMAAHADDDDEDEHEHHHHGGEGNGR